MSEQQLVLMRMPLGPLGTNCYVIGDKAIGEAFIIDPATAGSTRCAKNMT